MKRLVVLIIAVTMLVPVWAQSTKKNDHSFKAGYSCSIIPPQEGEGLVLNRFHCMYQFEPKNCCFGFGLMVPSSQDMDFGISIMGGPKFNWDYLRISAEFVAGHDHHQWQIGGGIQATYLAIGPLSGFIRVQCCFPVETPIISVGNTPFTTLTIGLGIHRLHHEYPKYNVKTRK